MSLAQHKELVRTAFPDRHFTGGPMTGATW
jgi:hypothetical protein